MLHSQVLCSPIETAPKLEIFLHARYTTSLFLTASKFLFLNPILGLILARSPPTGLIGVLLGYPQMGPLFTFN